MVHYRETNPGPSEAHRYISTNVSGYTAGEVAEVSGGKTKECCSHCQFVSRRITVRISWEMLSCVYRGADSNLLVR